MCHKLLVGTRAADWGNNKGGFWASLSVGRYGRACSKEGIILGMNYVIFLSGNGERSRHGCASRAGLAAGGARGEALCPPGHVAGPRRIPGPQTAPRIWRGNSQWLLFLLPSPPSKLLGGHTCAEQLREEWGGSKAPLQPPLVHQDHPPGSGLCDTQSIPRIGANGGGSTGAASPCPWWGG